MSGSWALSYGSDDMYCEMPLGAVSSGPREGRLRAGISLARAGDMDFSRRTVLPWRGRLLAALGIDGGRLLSVRQVHSRRVLMVDGLSPSALENLEADGLVSRGPDAVLAITVADCLPIFLADPVTGAFGLVHSGWKGTGIAVEAIRFMGERFGTRVGDMRVTIGPGIGACCYKVPEERCDQFAARFGEDAVVRGSAGDFRLDLGRANVSLLEKAGVRDIMLVSDCTCCSPALGSFRREGPAGFTHMLAFIGRWP